MLLPKKEYIDIIAVLLLLVPEEYDYVAWRFRMEDCLRQRHLWDIVEAATEPPKPEDDENTFNAWSKKNAKALYLIWESSDAFFSFKKSTRTAQIAWDTLEEFGSPGGSYLSFNILLYRIVAISLQSLKNERDPTF